jgi:endoglucanase
MRRQHVLRAAGVSAVLAAAVLAAAAPGAGAQARTHGLDPATRFYVPPPPAGATREAARLERQGHASDGALITAMTQVPQAVWLTRGAPAKVREMAANAVAGAAAQGAVPVLVAYFIPGRDCAQYSKGGAKNTAQYLAWIDGLAKGIGSSEAIVLLEPDSLGLLPSSCGGPNPGYPFTDEERYAELNGAVDRLTALPHTHVYLDATHSAWLAVGDIAKRLVTAGVQRADGYFVDVSNFQPTPELLEYGKWISECIAFANNPDDGGWRLGHYDYCASQYYPATFSDFSTWHLSDEWYAANLGNAVPVQHFVVDTSRNGTGPNDMTAYAAPPYNQPAAVISGLQAGSWCNPPGAGLGLRPTADTGVPLLDAYLWVKTPGQSDGQCDSAGGARAWDYTIYDPWGISDPTQQSLFDPLWGRFDPAAGAWFPQQALQLAQNAQPPLS